MKPFIILFCSLRYSAQSSLSKGARSVILESRKGEASGRSFVSQQLCWRLSVSEETQFFSCSCWPGWGTWLGCGHVLLSRAAAVNIEQCSDLSLCGTCLLVITWAPFKQIRTAPVEFRSVSLICCSVVILMSVCSGSRPEGCVRGLRERRMLPGVPKEPRRASTVWNVLRGSVAPGEAANTARRASAVRSRCLAGAEPRIQAELRLEMRSAWPYCWSQAAVWVEGGGGR